MKIVKFRAAHLDALQLQDAQTYFHGEFNDPSYGRALEQSQYSFTALDGDKVICCAGMHEVWPGRAVAWALVSKDAGPHLRAIHRATLGFMAQSPWRRIEAMVEGGFEAGHRWIKMLGFVCETPDAMRGYSPSGVDFYLYSRVK